jgi:hypothetical protein
LRDPRQSYFSRCPSKKRRAIALTRTRRHLCVVTPVADAIEVRHPHIVTRDRLAIDDAGPRAQPSYELDDQRETMHQIGAGAAVKPRTDAVLTGNDSREDRALGQWRQIGHRDLTQMRRDYAPLQPPGE